MSYVKDLKFQHAISSVYQTAVAQTKFDDSFKLLRAVEAVKAYIQIPGGPFSYTVYQARNGNYVVQQSQKKGGGTESIYYTVSPNFIPTLGGTMPDSAKEALEWLNTYYADPAKFRSKLIGKFMKWSANQEDAECNADKEIQDDIRDNLNKTRDLRAFADRVYYPFSTDRYILAHSARYLKAVDNYYTFIGRYDDKKFPWNLLS